MKTMRIAVALYTLFACVITAWSGTHPDGISKVSREQDALGNYKFSYAVTNTEGEHFRKEGTDHLGRVIGTYGLTHVDGTHRVVDYVADKDGFRAEIRSNEPGVISSESADTSVVKLRPELSLAAAATSIDSSGAVFGTRLKTDSPKVSYASPDEDKSLQPERLDNSPRESRPSNYEDYRPLSPVAYYPGSAIETARPLNAPARSLTHIPERPRLQNPSSDTRPSDVYLPPLDPHTAVRRPPFLPPRERTTDSSSYSTTSRRPYLPPYGGFDDDPLPVDRRPGVSMSTIHGGLGRDDFHPPQTSTPAYGAGRYPSDDAPLSRDFISPHFPARSNFPPLPRLPGGLISTPPRNSPGPVFGPPSYDSGLRPNFVLRAVPIPNGIQAVRIDPETGRVYDRLMYPLFIRNGQPVYDRNVLLHNDDVSDDDAIRNRSPGYLDIPFGRRSPFRAVRNPSSDEDEDFGNRTRQFNRSFDPLTLSIPTARDLEWVRRQLSQVEGFERARFPNPSRLQNNRFENSEYPLFNDFDDSSDEENEDRHYSRNRNSEPSRDYSFSRNHRLIDRLTPEDTKTIVSKSQSLILDAKTSETDPKPAIIDKE